MGGLLPITLLGTAVCDSVVTQDGRGLQWRGDSTYLNGWSRTHLLMGRSMCLRDLLLLAMEYGRLTAWKHSIIWRCRPGAWGLRLVVDGGRHATSGSRSARGHMCLLMHLWHLRLLAREHRRLAVWKHSIIWRWRPLIERNSIGYLRRKWHHHQGIWRTHHVVERYRHDRLWWQTHHYWWIGRSSHIHRRPPSSVGLLRTGRIVWRWIRVRWSHAWWDNGRDVGRGWAQRTFAT